MTRTWVTTVPLVIHKNRIPGKDLPTPQVLFGNKSKQFAIDSSHLLNPVTEEVSEVTMGCNVTVV